MSAQSASDANPFPGFAEIEIRERDAAPSAPRGPVPPRPFRPRVHDGSRTRFESRVAFGAADADDLREEIPATTRRFSVLETTSGLPDDSREEDEWRAERWLLDLRGRVKAARAAIATTPGAEEVLRLDWVRAARFYGHFGITEAMFRHGVSNDAVDGGEDFLDGMRVPVDESSEVWGRHSAGAPCPDLRDPLARP